MQEVQRLVAPPGGGSGGGGRGGGVGDPSSQQDSQLQLVAGHSHQQQQQQQHASHHYYWGDWKAPRAVNHLECDSCGADGDLLCCDRCPASFHPECLNPPMDRELAPTHDWFCHECSLRLLAKDAAGSAADQLEADASPGDCLHALAALAESLNPKEFAPPESCQLVAGTPVPGPSCSGRRCGAARMIELELGAFVPQPVRRCFVCGDTCRRAPLLPCDFCPLCYHLDCLDTPLTVAPARSELWMCPAHAEHLVDLRLLTSARLSERVTLWNQLARAGVSQREVLGNFVAKRRFWRHLRQAINTRQRQQLQQQQRGATAAAARLLGRHHPQLLAASPPPGVVSIPLAVKAAYRRPPPPPPSPAKQRPLPPPPPPHQTGGIVVGSERSELERCAAAALEQLSASSCILPVPPAPSQPPCLAYLVRLDDDWESGVGSGGSQQRKSVSSSGCAVFRLTQRVNSLGLLDCNSVPLGRLWGVDCPLVDPEEHAVIFADCPDQAADYGAAHRDEACFELLNYSRHGSRVDGALYGLEANASRSSRQPVLSELVRSVDDFLGGGDDATAAAAGAASTVDPALPKPRRYRRRLRCRCWAEPSATPAGWEGSATLRHGSVIGLGCVSLLFVLPQ